MATVTVLGCDGSYPGPGGAASGYLLRTSTTAVWLDAGSGTFAALQREVAVGDLDAVICSHEHPDHWSDLEGLAVAAGHGAARGPIAVFAPPGLRQRSYHAEDPILSWRLAEDGAELTIGDLEFRFAETGHGPPTMAVAVTDQSSVLAYSADCGAEWSFEVFGRRIATALCEATYTKGDEGHLAHLSGRQAGTMAREASVGRLVLTHRWPTVSARALADEAGEAFGSSVEQAQAGRTWEW